MKTLLLVVVISIKFFIAKFAIKKQNEIFKYFPYGKLLKYHYEKNKKYLWYLGIIWFFISLIIFWLIPEYKKEIIIFFLLDGYVFYKAYLFDREVNIRLTAYDEQGRWIYKIKNMKFPMPHADVTLEE